MSKPPACTMRRPRAAPVRVSSALTRRLPWYEGRGCFIGGKSAYCSHGLGPGTCAYCRESVRDSSKGLRVVKRSRMLLSQFFAKLDFIPRSAESDTSLLTAVIAFGAVVIYCVKRNNPASADADAEMVPADAIANPTLFKRLLNA